jgi:hypothetical protein
MRNLKSEKWVSILLAHLSENQDFFCFLNFIKKMISRSNFYKIRQPTLKAANPALAYFFSANRSFFVWGLAIYSTTTNQSTTMIGQSSCSISTSSNSFPIPPK